MGNTERPRRIVRPTQQGPGAQPGLGAQPASAPANPAPGVVRRELYTPRSGKLMDAVGRLDAGLDQQACRSLAEWVREHYTTAYASTPLGFVARCHLGPPYVDHQLSLLHVIVRHFSAAEPMPEPFSAARMLARSGGYAYIEVYDDGLILPVLDDGTVVRP
ncbi:hypothetical protein AQI88_23220 [Streptomyces cellostaticus]|uniref:Uncharacterized protein n=1 Tax=Streptomyces cellostaticus TaxID=67285 RepID=A0A101NJE7_9ACTN|nr:hypothetical protein [Streptomyces cellostaticus]KUM94152.1 hypothetical protein AQI88_23220 [Streptomyces cellostaticus]GHI05318.1 hypothetical protein Scel_36390 [Streptomyces cellostaticus]